MSVLPLGVNFSMPMKGAQHVPDLTNDLGATL
jgi:hypothetical protein